MKSILFTTIFLAACASTTGTNQSVQPIDRTLYQPPVEVDITISDRVLREREAVVKEEDAYNTSLKNIDDKMSRENLDYQMCSATSEAPDKKDCKEKLQQYCRENMMVDTRQGHHEKPYCRELDKRHDKR